MERIWEWLAYENNEGPTSRPVIEQHRQLLRHARSTVAGLINAVPEEISLTQNTTEGLNLVLNGIDWHQGDEVVTCDLEHPSVLIPAYFLRQRHGVKVKVVEIPPNAGKTEVLERFAAAMSPRTRLLFLSHIQFSCGLRLPAPELAELAHRRGAWILLDGAQGAGHVNLDVREIDCDFYAMPGHKWLLGPDGVGALYIRKELIPELQPRKVGGSAIKGFDRDGNMEPKSDEITKFELTTTSIPLFAGMIAAIEFLQEIGLTVTENRATTLATRAEVMLSQIPGVVVTSPRDSATRSGLVTFTLPRMEPVQVVEQLWERAKVVTRSVQWPPGVRLSTAFFITEDEIDQVCAVVGEMAGQ
jgi:L-cysteine/cystine lyase